MAETKTPNYSGLSAATDLSKFPVYDVPETDRESYIKSTEDTLKALEDRYSNPNWFKVAAGFLKPQLGGFFASLGSAGEALGENVEQQRAMALPIAEVRAKLAQQKALLGQNVDVSAEIKAWHIAHPNEVPPPGLVSHWASKAPDSPAVKALTGQQDLSMKQQQLLATQQGTEMNRLMEMRKEGLITPAEYQRRLQELETRAQGIPKSPNVPSSTTPAVEPPPSTGGAEAPAPSGSPATAQAPAAKPPEAAPDFKINPSFAVSQLNPRAVTELEKAQNARLIEGAKLLEEVKQRQYQNLQVVNEPTNYATAKEANESALNMLDKEPELAVKTTNMLRKAGPLVALLERGIGISIGPYGANINVAGAKPALYATLSPDEQKYQDALLNNIARSVYYDLKSRGIDPEKEGAEKFGQRMLQETHIEQGPAAIHRALAQNDIRLKHNRALYEATNKYYPKAQQVSLSPLHDLYTQHPEFKILERMLDKKLQAAK
jgi:hypothetical protein